MNPPIEQNWDKVHIGWFWGTPVQFYRHKRSPNLFVATSDEVPDLYMRGHSIFGLDQKLQRHFLRRERAKASGREGLNGEEQQT